MGRKGKKKGRGCQAGKQQMHGSLPGFTPEQRLSQIPSPEMEPSASQRSPVEPQAPLPKETATRLPPVDEPRKCKGTKPKMHVMAPEKLGFELKERLIVSSLPRRPSVGVLGRRIRLVSNCFPVRIPSGYIYHYDVDVKKKKGAETDLEEELADDSKDKKYRCLSTKINRQVVNLMLDTAREFRNVYAAYDGRKNLYTRRPLDIDTHLKCVIALDDGDGESQEAAARNYDVSEFVVIVKPVKKKEDEGCAISLDTVHAVFEGSSRAVPYEAIMALDTILRHGPCLRFTPVGRSFFFPPDELHPLSGGREIWFGYHQSLRLGQWKPFVNMDVTASTFYSKGPVIKYICKILNISEKALRGRRFFTDAEVRKLTEEMKNLKIEVNHLSYKRKYRIFKCTRECAEKLEFTYQNDNKTIKTTVEQYFLKQYKKKLEFPFLPCLQVKPKQKKVYLPAEVCIVLEGQHCKKELEEKQLKEMIRFTSCRPVDRFRDIKKLTERARFDQDNCLKDFGMKVYCEPLKLEGRVIEAPNVRYNAEERIKPKDGAWNMKNKKFFRGAVVNSWVILSLADVKFCGRDELSDFAYKLRRIGQEAGISINPVSRILIPSNRRVDIRDELANIKREFAADLVVVVVPVANRSIYGEVKQAAETILGLTTQCIKDENVVRNCTTNLLGNLCQKINAKMGGVNNSLTPGETPLVLRRPVIIIGADVTHPSPSQELRPSIAAAVGSLDAHPSRYAVACKTQMHVDENKQAVEIIVDLKNMVVELLKAFYRNTHGKKPEKIIFLRDGVSEGQFEKVRDYEVKCVRDACKSLNEDYQPGITFIVVQKRHHIRFMPEDSQDGVGRMLNIPAGTAVDTSVTHPLNNDFYLCSHFGQQGTSRPGHYLVIEDDNDFSADDLQRLTYYLCHIYARCTKSISIPAPVQYAHLAAYRARQHALRIRLDDSSSGSDSGDAQLCSILETDHAIKVVDGFKDTMYFV